jgi:tRNA A37 threonylcarbamoyltransferase TsaD
MSALRGGVAANSTLRELFKQKAGQEGLRFYFPDKILCTDNAAMVACAGYYHYLAGDFAPLTQEACANHPLIVANLPIIDVESRYKCYKPRIRVRRKNGFLLP